MQENGGTIEPLEKNADMLIADHARKDSPPGAYSWQFIADSVKNGVIQLKDRYRIGGDPELQRPAGGGGMTRSGRTQFTRAEDALLARWVLSHALDRSGNKIYQELGAQVSWLSPSRNYIRSTIG